MNFNCHHAPLMRILPFCFLALVSLNSHLANADVGLGLVLGQPTGLSAIFSTSRHNAIDAALAWDFDDGDKSLHLHSDYLWLKNAGLRVDNVSFDWFFGVGGRLLIYDHDRHHHHDDDYKLGIRGPIGIGHTFKKPRIELFVELALIMNILESTSADIDGGLGARYHF